MISIGKNNIGELLIGILQPSVNYLTAPEKNLVKELV